MSSIGTEGGAWMPGAASTSAPSPERTAGGTAAEDQSIHTSVPGRVVAARTVPSAGPTGVTSPLASEIRTSRVRASWSIETSSAAESRYQTASETSPGTSSTRSVWVPVARSQISSSPRPRRSCRTTSRSSPAIGAKPIGSTPLPGPSHSSPATEPSATRITRIAGCRLSPCSLCAIASRLPSWLSAPTQASSRCS